MSYRSSQCYWGVKSGYIDELLLINAFVVRGNCDVIKIRLTGGSRDMSRKDLCPWSTLFMGLILAGEREVIYYRYWPKCRVPTVMENPGKSWNLKPSWKVMEKSWIFVFFQEVMENWYFEGKSWKGHGILHKPSVLCTMYGYGNLVVCI